MSAFIFCLRKEENGYSWNRAIVFNPPIYIVIFVAQFDRYFSFTVSKLTINHI